MAAKLRSVCDRIVFESRWVVGCSSLTDLDGGSVSVCVFVIEREREIEREIDRMNEAKVLWSDKESISIEH